MNMCALYRQHEHAPWSGQQTTLRRRTGYILVEAMVAMGLLSLGMLSINTGLRQAVLVRGETEDLTLARFMLEEIMTDLEMQPELRESSGSGRFPGEQSRFRYEWEVRRVSIPRPTLPSDATEADITRFEEQFKDFMGSVTVIIRWTRAGNEYEVVGETLLRPEQLWTPPRN